MLEEYYRLKAVSIFRGSFFIGIYMCNKKLYIYLYLKKISFKIIKLLNLYSLYKK